MPAFQPAFAALPSEIPFFPLPGALLLPGGRLPLNIFEPRYLAMTEDCLAGGRFLGMVQPDPAQGGDQPYRIGCLGRVSSFAETEDGRFLISLTGLIRFRILAEVAMRHGYRRAQVAYDGFAPDLDRDAPPPLIDRPALVAALRPYFASRGIEADWPSVENMADAALVTTLCMLCPFEVREKQALLEAPGVSDRAEMLVALLRMGRHGMAPEGRPS